MKSSTSKKRKVVKPVGFANMLRRRSVDLARMRVLKSQPYPQRGVKKVATRGKKFLASARKRNLIQAKTRKLVKVNITYIFYSILYFCAYIDLYISILLLILFTETSGFTSTS